jgi:hypothetical protein
VFGKRPHKNSNSAGLSPLMSCLALANGSIEYMCRRIRMAVLGIDSQIGRRIVVIINGVNLLTTSAPKNGDAYLIN